MPTNISKNAQNLLEKMIDYKNDERATLKELINHEWFIHKDDVAIDKKVLKRLKLHK